MDATLQAKRFRSTSLRRSTVDEGYKIYLSPRAERQISLLSTYARVQAERDIQSLSAVVRPRSVGRLAFQVEQANHVMVSRNTVVSYRIHPPAVTVTSITAVHTVTELPATAPAAQKIADCLGRCHRIAGRGAFQPMTAGETGALASSAFSAAGGAAAAIACSTTLTSCGLAVVLTADAARQFVKASGEQDPVVWVATNAGATESEAKGMAIGADYLTAVVSINGAFKGVLMRWSQGATIGSFAALGGDAMSTVHTVNELQRSAPVLNDK